MKDNFLGEMDETFSLFAVLYDLCHLSSSLEREYLKTLQEQSN